MWALEQSYSEDETVALFQQGSNKELYKIHTVGKLCQATSVFSSPNVISKYAGEKLVVVVDKHVHILNKVFKEFALSIEFESQVDCIEVTDDAQLLLVGEQNGSFSIHHIDSGKRLIKKNLVKPAEEKPSFFSIRSILSPNDMLQVSVLTIGSVLYNFKNLNMKLLANAICIQDWDEIKNILGRLETSVTNLSTSYESSLPKGLFYSPRNSILCCYGSGRYNFGIDIRDSVSQHISPFIENSSEIKKALYSNDGRFIFAIDTKGCLLVCSGSTYIPIKIWNAEEIIDFTLLEITDGKFTVYQQILVFLINSAKSETYELVYKYWPSMKDCYRVNVSDYSYLVDPVLNGDSVCVVEGIRSNSKNSVDILKIRVISEALPQMRFEKLIQKGRYKEAELFAKQYNLDLEEVYKSYVMSLASGDLNTETVNKIKEFLQKIKDPKFVTDIALKIRAPSMDITKEVYCFCIEFIKNLTPEASFESLQEVFLKEEKLKSFVMLYTKPEDWLNWFKFSQIHWAEIFLIFIKGDETEKAFFVWRQHYKEILTIFNEYDIEEVLKEIPDNTQSSELGAFLRYSFLPPILLKYPTLVGQLSNWIIGRSDMYEVLEKALWPSNSIKLLSVLPEICTKITEEFKHSPISASLETCDFLKLDSRIKDLKELNTLKSQYQSSLSLAQYSQEDKMQVAFIILDLLVKTNKVDHGINHFLLLFFKKNKLNNCNVFCKYIADLIKNQNVGWWYWSESPWEEGAIQVATYIKDPHLKSQVFTQILGQARVPWSTQIQGFAEQQLKENPSFIYIYDDKVRYAVLRNILLKYNMRSFNLHEFRKAESLMSYILKYPSKTALADALVVVDAYDHLNRSECYLRYAIILLQRRKVDDFLEIFYSLSEAEMTEYGPRVISYCEISLEDPDMFIQLKDFKYLKLCSYFGVKIASRLLQISPTDSQYQFLFQHMKQVYRLQLELGIFDKRCLVINDDDKWKLFMTVANGEKALCANEISMSADEKKQSTISNLTYLERILSLGDILALPKVKVRGEIISKLAIKGDLEEAINQCKSLAQLNVSTDNIMNVLETILTNEELIASNGLAFVIQDLHNIACQALCNCTPGMILKCACLSQWTAMLVDLHALDQNFGCNNSSVAQMDKYNVWKFSKIYRDQGMGVNLKEILSNALKCLKIICFQSQKLNFSSILNFFAMSRDIIGHLRSKSLESTALNMSLFLQSNILCRFWDDENEHLNMKQIQHLEDANSQTKRAVKDICSSLLLRVINQKHCDLSFGLNLLLALNISDALKIIQELISRYHKDHFRIKSLATIAIKYGEHLKNTTLVEKVTPVLKKAAWAEELSKLKINCKDIFNISDEKILWNIMKELLEIPSVEFNQIENFCNDFSMEKNEVLLFYLKKLLRNSKIQDWGYANLPDDKQKKELNELLVKCNFLVREISNKADILDLLIEIFPLTNSYCYEALVFLCQNVKEISSAADLPIDESFWSKNIKIVNFLKKYRRINQATEFEYDKWELDHPNCSDLPKIASSCLPLHLMCSDEDISKIINPELSPNTLDEWLMIANSIGFNDDVLRLKTIKNYVLKWLKDQQDANTILYQPCDEEFLSTIKVLGRNIKSYEMMLSCVNWVVKIIPLCQTKVEVAALANQISGYSPKNKPSNIRVTELANISLSLYNKLALDLILQKFEICCHRYMELTHNPQELIVAILEDVGDCNIFTIPENRICDAIKEIAKVGHCDLIEIFTFLIDSWMPWGNLDTLADDTFTFNLNEMPLDFHSQNKDVWTSNLRRTINLLNHIAKEEAVFRQLKTLINSSNNSTTQKVQATICCLVVFDETIIKEMTGFNNQDLRKYLRDLLYVAQLEELQQPYSLEIFRTCNKLDLVRTVLRFNSRNPKALSFSSSLCIEENEWDIEIWNIILTNLVALHKVDELSHVLEQLNSEATFRMSQSFLKAWEFKIKHDIEQCKSAMDACALYSNILRCSCHKSLNLVEVAKALFKFSAIPALATYLLLPNSKEHTKKTMLQYKSPQCLKEEYENLMQELTADKRLEYSLVAALLNEV